MRRTLSMLLPALLASQLLFAQTSAPPSDDMPFIFLLGLILICIALGSMVIGGIICIAALSITLAMASAGIISTAIIAGLYKRSVLAGFKTALILVSAIGGAIAGITGLYIVNEVFTLHLSQSIIAWSGLAGGLIGGILLGLMIISIIRIGIGLFKEKLSL